MAGPKPGPNVVGVPIVGQPFTLTMARCPVDATLTCNCGGADAAVTITASVQAACPSCGRQYLLAFNPTTAKLEVYVNSPVPQVSLIQ